MTDVSGWEQSDRPYEPFLPSPVEKTHWFDMQTGVEGAQRAAAPPPAPGRFPQTLTSSTASMSARDTMARPQPALHPFASRERTLNPWAVLSDWRRAADSVRVTERCLSRGEARVVLARGTERLYLAESDATPVMLVRDESELLWGGVSATYLWNTWWAVNGGGAFPLASFRMVDGIIQVRRGVQFNTAQMLAADSAPRLTMPRLAAMPTMPGAGFSFPPPDSVRVGRDAYLLKAVDYSEVVLLRRDTVFLLDATTSEARARTDSTWIAKLFPGPHPVVVVVSDLAWPHIGGVRFWVARGATIVSHALSRDMLVRVAEWRGRGVPDVLDQRRPRPKLAFRAVTDSLALAGGEVKVFALQGLSTEGAVATWIEGERYLWVGDYIQQADVPSVYARDVIRSVDAKGLSPARFGAQHVPLGDWASIKAVNEAWR